MRTPRPRFLVRIIPRRSEWRKRYSVLICIVWSTLMRLGAFGSLPE